MKKEDLIKKWLNHEQFTKKESEMFQALDVSDSYIKISETAKKFTSPDFDLEENLNTIITNISLKRNKAPKSITSYKTLFFRIASVIVIGLGLYFGFLKEYNTSVTTQISEKIMVTLPDNSTVHLNTKSSIVYNKEKWENQRSVTLQGEAFFKVFKGKKFKVHTTTGIITVIGTQFNVKQRDNYFEVACYEGLVQVYYNNQITKLPAGHIIRIIDNIITKIKSIEPTPDWIKNKSSFVSVPYFQIIKELERHYDIKVTLKNIDQTTLFTGNFVHSDIEMALRSITIPMRLRYTIKNKDVILYKE